MKKILIAALAASSLLLLACADAPGAKKTLEAAGYSDIKAGGYDFFACSEDDTYHTKFTAKGPTGIPVSGTVCRGMFFKNSTIRFNN